MFRRLKGANEALSLPELSDRLNHGLAAIDEDIIATIEGCLPEGSYVPLLLQVQPRLVLPVLEGDYFAHEQVDTWGTSSFWGLPENPRTPYYRTFETRVHDDAHLYEFVVPMVPPSWNTGTRVNEFIDLLAVSGAPTALAVSILDICQPATTHSSDGYAHWAITHYLLDGHHKMEAAAASGQPLRLLSLLSVGDGLSSPEQVLQAVQLRQQAAASRAHPR